MEATRSKSSTANEAHAMTTPIQQPHDCDWTSQVQPHNVIIGLMLAYKCNSGRADNQKKMQPIIDVPSHTSNVKALQALTPSLSKIPWLRSGYHLQSAVVRLPRNLIASMMTQQNKHSWHSSLVHDYNNHQGLQYVNATGMQQCCLTDQINQLGRVL